jgi:hypothetical protein
VVWQTFIHATVCARVKSGSGGGWQRPCLQINSFTEYSKIIFTFAWPKCQMMMMMMTTRLQTFWLDFPSPLTSQLLY